MIGELTIGIWNGGELGLRRRRELEDLMAETAGKRRLLGKRLKELSRVWVSGSG